MSRDEFIGKLQMVYVGDRNALDEIVGVYDELKKDTINEVLRNDYNLCVKDLKKSEKKREKLEKENQKLNNILNELEKDFEKYDLEYLYETYQTNLANFIDVELSKMRRLKELKESDN